MNRNRKGFTLIEMIVVLIIVAVVSLIAIPSVLQINDKVKVEANKRSVDAYGKALELANIEYKLDHGYYSYDIDELNVKYNGSKVKCDEVVINNDGTVYLKKCKIDDEYVEDNYNHYKYYQYGRKKIYYHIGDVVYYNNMKFYVMRNAYRSDKYLTLIKGDAVLYDDLISITQGTELYDFVKKGTYNFATVPFYAPTNNCYYQNYNTYDYSGCENDYNSSILKRYVDLWTSRNFDDADLFVDEFGYKNRLISKDELFDLFTFESASSTSISVYYIGKSELYNSIFALNNATWTMSLFDDSNYQAYYISSYDNKSGLFFGNVVNNIPIRPIVNIRTSKLEEK